MSGYVDRVAKLVRLDATLLSIETKENLFSVGIALALLFGALVIASLGLIVLLFAAVLVLIQLGLDAKPSRSFGGGRTICDRRDLAFVGIERLKSWSLTPRRTLAHSQIIFRLCERVCAMTQSAEIVETEAALVRSQLVATQQTGGRIGRVLDRFSAFFASFRKIGRPVGELLMA